MPFENTGRCCQQLALLNVFPGGVNSHTLDELAVMDADEESEEMEVEVIEPAKQGTLNVLKAAASHGINRVVLTSSVIAIFGGITEDRGYAGDD